MRLRQVWPAFVLSLAVFAFTTPVSAAPAKPSAPAQPSAPAKASVEPSASAKTTPAKPSDASSDPPPSTDAKNPAEPEPKPRASSRSNVRQTDLYGDRIDGLQAEVDALKDKVFRSKARLSMLRETVLRGVMSGGRVILGHRNKMGASFKLVRVVVALDGAQIYARTDETGSLDGEDELVVFDGNLPPGPHTLEVELTYKGHGFGVFSYLSGYTFESTDVHPFEVPERGAMKIVSVGYEEGNLTTEMADRPNVTWEETPLDASGRPVASSRGRRATR